MTAEELEKTDWSDPLLGQNDVGYIIRCDLSYPHSIHDSTASVPLAPMKKAIKFDQLSDFQQTDVAKLGSIGKSYVSQPKLI